MRIRETVWLHTTPLLRWQRDIEQVRQLPPATDMRRLFFHRVDRLVRKDSTFLLKNRFFEAPSLSGSPRQLPGFQNHAGTRAAQ